MWTHNYSWQDSTSRHSISFEVWGSADKRQLWFPKCFHSAVSVLDLRSYNNGTVNHFQRGDNLSCEFISEPEV